MHKFLSTLSFFSIPFVLVSFALDIFISNNLLKSNTSPGNFKTWNDIYQGKINSELLIYGSSRAAMQIDPEIIEDSLNLKTYNFGILGHNFPTQYLRHIEYLKYNKPPKHIILSIDLFSLEKRKDLYESDQFLPYMFVNRNIWKYTKSHDEFSLVDFYIPLIRYIGKSTAKSKAIKLAFTSNNIEPFKRKGFRSTEKQWNKDLFNKKLKESPFEVKIDSFSVSLFNQFLSECKEANIPVTLIYTPEFIEGQKFIINREEIFNIYRDYSTKYNLTFIDYSKDTISLKKEYFYNSLHLNKTGAELFSRKLALDLKVMLYNNMTNIGNFKSKNINKTNNLKFSPIN